MRDAVAWCLTRARTWAALVAATVATVLASGDGRTGWTLVVAGSTFGLAFLSMRAHYLDEHPDLPDRRQARHDELVERALRRYRGEPDPPKQRATRERAEPEKAAEPKQAAERESSFWAWVFDPEVREARRQAKYDMWVERTLREYRARADAEGGYARRLHRPEMPPDQAARAPRHARDTSLPSGRHAAGASSRKPGDDPAGGQPWLSP